MIVHVVHHVKKGLNVVLVNDSPEKFYLFIFIF